MNALHETWAVFSHETRRSVRSAKTLVLLILYSLAALLGGVLFVAATRKIQSGLTAMTAGQQMPPEALEQMKMGSLALFFGKDETLLHYLADIPLIVLFFFKFALLFLPLLIVLMGFDQISGELQSRAMRFAALRSSRGALLAGKVAAQVVLLLGLTAVINALLFAYAAATTEGFALGPGLVALIKFWLLTLVFGLAYIGLTAMCSALFRAPVFSLLTALCALFGFWLIAVMGRFESLKLLSYLAPSHYEDGLISPSWPQAFTSVGAYVAFAAVFLSAAWLALRTRDI